MRALLAVVKGTPGHPLHPPFTDATIGAYTVASFLGILAAAGVSSGRTASGWWLALLVALCLTVPTALTGLVDWLGMTRGTPLWWTATAHLTAMVTGSVVFLIALLVGHGDYTDGVVTAGPLTLTLVGYGLLTLGGWLGGTVVFVHGMRVLNLVDEPATRAAMPQAPGRDRDAA